MERYDVTGMSCAACSARVEKAVSKVNGVSKVSVNLLSNSMTVEGNVPPEDIIKAVEDAGYGASLKNNKNIKNNSKEKIGTESNNIKTRLIVSVIFWVILMYVSMGHMLWNFPLPEIFARNHIAIGIFEMLLTIIIMVLNQKFFISGFKGLFKGAPNMDSLVAIGSSAAFLYSTYALFAMTNAMVTHDMQAVMKYMDEFYFESAATILTLITVGKMLEARAKGKTTDALRGLINLSPKKATILINDEPQVVDISTVKVGDIFIVKPGESIPVDGVVVDGSSAVNESALTGESIPVDKKPGSIVSAATINQSGFIKCEAKRVGEDTMLSKIIQMVSDASASKAPIAKIADKVSGIFVPAVITIALLTIGGWLIAGYGVGFALARGISVLVISCPCALGLATPVAIMVGNGIGARNGILFKNATALENLGKVKIVALDKTGTITKGEPVVTDVFSAGNLDDLLKNAYFLEKNSEHPLSKAIIKYTENNKYDKINIRGFEATPGLGLKAYIGDEFVFGGNEAFVSGYAVVEINMMEAAKKYSAEGKTSIYFGKGSQILGIIAVADVLKDESKNAISELKTMGIRTVMLTGDNEITAKAIAAKAGIDEVIAGVLPDGKDEVIINLKKQGKVAMVGDGINDAPALTRADVGIAIGAGTDIAIDAAEVVLVKSRLDDVPASIRLSRYTLKNIHENLFWAFIYNVIGIPIAAGILIKAFGITMSPMLGAAAMSLSSFCVVSNALRLNLKKIKKINFTIEEKEEMTKTIKVEGMMCGHCEAHVKKALEGIEGVKSATASHTEGTAVVELATEVSDDILTSAVTEAGYEVKGIN